MMKYRGVRAPISSKGVKEKKVNFVNFESKDPLVFVVNEIFSEILIALAVHC